MPEDNKYKKHQAKLKSGGYGKSSKDKRVLHVEIKDENGKVHKVSPNYKGSLGDARKVGTPVYQKAADVKGLGTQGKIKKAGAVGRITPPDRPIKKPLEKVDVQSSKYGSVKKATEKENLISKSNTYSSKTKKEGEEKDVKSMKEAGVSGVKSKSDVGEREYKSNEAAKAANDKNKYVSGSQTKKQIDANRTARRMAKASGGEGTRKAYKKLLDKEKAK